MYADEAIWDKMKKMIDLRDRLNKRRVETQRKLEEAQQADDRAAEAVADRDRAVARMEALSAANRYAYTHEDPSLSYVRKNALRLVNEIFYSKDISKTDEDFEKIQRIIAEHKQGLSEV
jgi:hypothetical protein